MKQSAFRPSKEGDILPRLMHISADSRDELDDLIALHKADGWRVKSCTATHDGTFMATLGKVI